MEICIILIDILLILYINKSKKNKHIVSLNFVKLDKHLNIIWKSSLVARVLNECTLFALLSDPHLKIHNCYLDLDVKEGICLVIYTLLFTGMQLQWGSMKLPLSLYMYVYILILMILSLESSEKKVSYN